MPSCAGLGTESARYANRRRFALVMPSRWRAASNGYIQYAEIRLESDAEFPMHSKYRLTGRSKKRT